MDIDIKVKITVAICTKNRENDLQKCIKSIAQQKTCEKFEVLIIDDGNLSREFLDECKNILKNIQLLYYKKKKDEKGLFFSRIKSIDLANGEIILFLDDDVILKENYIDILIKTFKIHPGIVGVGGIDILYPTYSVLKKLYDYVFLFSSNNPGKLSLTGFNSSIGTWSKQTAMFETEFLSGCNMSFKKKAIENLQDPCFFKSYSLGEDLYLSLFASRSGKLLVNPHLQILHFQSPLSRDSIVNVAKMKVINHFKLLKYLNKPKIKYILIFWTFFGMIISSLLKFDFHELKGYFLGLKNLFSNNKD